MPGLAGVRVKRFWRPSADLGLFVISHPPHRAHQCQHDIAADRLLSAVKRSKKGSFAIGMSPVAFGTSVPRGRLCSSLPAPASKNTRAETGGSYWPFETVQYLPEVYLMLSLIF